MLHRHKFVQARSHTHQPRFYKPIKRIAFGSVTSSHFAALQLCISTRCYFQRCHFTNRFISVPAPERDRIRNTLSFVDLKFQIDVDVYVYELWHSLCCVRLGGCYTKIIIMMMMMTMCDGCHSIVCFLPFSSSHSNVHNDLGGQRKVRFLHNTHK